VNAPFAPPRRARPSKLVPLARWLADPDSDWDAVADVASAPNSFGERWFVEASLRHLPHPPQGAMLAVRDEGQLIGLMPVFTAARYGRMPVAHVQNWQHYHCFYGAPLVRRSFEPFFWARVLETLDTTAHPFLHVAGLEADSRLATSLLAARRGSAIVHRSQRAILKRTSDARTFYETVVRKKKRKEIGRLKARLNELGTVSHRRFSTDDALDAWIEAFLALEASGWKGHGHGSALANADDTRAFLRDALTGAMRAGRLDMRRLDVEGRAIAMLVNFRCPPGAFSFKIAFDESFARYSPGVLVQLDNLDVLDEPGFEWMDSCAVEGHSMIESLWPERRALVRITVPLKGVRKRAIFGACRLLETASAARRRR
jgi:CelD/BcsL family acetyltransferase involved in cellulose biosynthesis